MSRQKRYLALGVLAAVLVVIWIAVAGNAQEKNEKEQGGNSGSTMNQEGGTHALGGSSEPAVNQKLDSYLKEQNEIMAGMMQGMEMVPKTGNASIDFLLGMIPHHESAIAMAESYLRYGGEKEELKQIAEDIISVQKTEIEEMNTMVENLEASGQKDEEKEAAYLERYTTMLSESHTMMHTVPASVEEAFAEGMIMHHQMAVDMSEIILEYSESEEVTALAKTIIETQKKEIAQMQEIKQQLQDTE